MMTTGAQPAWAGQQFRLDPERLPQKLCYATQSGEVTITVDRNGATLKRTLPQSGLPLHVALPRRVFRGVVARATETGPESALVTLELLHDDEALCVPLTVGHDLNKIAHDWQHWSELLGLPMMMVEADGVARTLEESARAIIMGGSQPRRHHAMFAERRPRFLARRRLGNLGVRLTVAGQEIIARDER
ncbi:MULTISPECIES: DUF6101 family protein [unclassified Roseitalea]|uniref:DUF6101 family protein n=1 Tax=unclassified Roseitalea TaxID=2639107 RepID=UPI00273D4DD5|nr:MULTISPECIES: DUF6101 family protein [unclassified Roseitalea]